ncbi:MAG: toxin-antitoxin system YwqK family antitoxin, partial [Planctomycetota bacterium]|nr:toxin-antitoxin system YwqK family antitoxin [Planctomycetota bacterium]
MTVLCAAALLCVPLGGEIHEWTNVQGQKIQAEFISATEKTVIISMKGKTYVVKLADLTPQSRALAAKLRVQKSTAQELVTNVVVDAPKVVVDVDHLEERDGLDYFEGKPFTGVAVQKYPNGQKKFEETYKDGKNHGLRTEWYENGQKKEEFTYKDGKRDGPTTGWYENGQKGAEATHKDGNPVTAIVWKPNGEKCPNTNLMNGNGIVCIYHENGQKRGEGTFNDGKPHGLGTKWYENGQKKEERTHKDGK